ncbi:hypothetical protein RhiirC2_794808 [Rhizophagus irregularis]|uniref:BAH domain-containing protein n=1 Tax=Rhizophagus irregularis TaxID=588596 RepID=A0A2N1MCV0_9GLOM|nr:hypothetical protein RhiirC2_794808 [Rhizophagus irregularis]
MRKQLKNHFILGFVPFGGNFNEFIKPFINEMKQLEKGKIFKINGQDSLIIASIGQITADLPQGNDLTGVKRHIAVKGCRSCQATRDIFTNPNLDIAAISHYHHFTDTQFEEINLATTIVGQKSIATNYGLCTKKSILDHLKRERHLQTPQDVYHLTARKIQRLLKPSCIKKLDLSTIQQRCNVNQGNAATKIIITCWKTIAETTAFIFKESFSKDDYMELQRCLEMEMIILSQAFEEFSNLPNLHANFHLVKNAKTFATLINSSVGVKEIVHKIFKEMVPKMNRKNIELDLMKRYMTLFALRHLIDGGIDPRISKFCESFTNLSDDFARIAGDWFIIEEQPYDSDIETNVQTNAENIVKLSLRQHMGYNAALIHKKIFIYELATYFYKNEHGTFTKNHLRIGDVVMMQIQDYNESYAIVEAIFSHRGNDNKLYVFIIVKWFEETNRTRLGCPVYRIQTDNR